MSADDPHPATAPATQPGTQPAAVQVKIDLNKAVALTMPKIDKDLTAEPFATPDGKSGWAIRIPGNRPIATPAYADGLIFVGGGYGSHEFYAFDADTGKLAWQMKTTDDGPTAAVVEDGFVAFNTESCTLIIADSRTGKLIWQEWLGDPLMSQPAISKDRIYIAYPGGNPRGPQVGEAAPQQGLIPNAPAQLKAAAAAPGTAVGPAKGHGHRLLCADLKTGKHIWEQDITSDVISAPIVEGDQVFMTCFDGTSFGMNTKDGSIVWQKHHGGTSAPLIADGQVIVTEKSVNARDKDLVASGKAEYLKKGNAGNVALAPTAQAAADASVGFAAAPSSANLAQASENVNVGTVAAGWSYQSAKAAYAHGQILNAQGNRFNCVRGVDGTVAWQAEVTGKDANTTSQMFAPPALGANNLYVCSAQGHLVSLGQKDGQLRFVYSTGQPMAFQPALAHGNMYAATINGTLICLKTGDKDADGWTAWAGTRSTIRNSEVEHL